MMNPFLERRRSFPLKLLVDIHSYCNGRCTMCPYPRYARRQSQGRMEWQLYRRIVDELGQIGRENRFVPMMSYCYMGEPFLADDLARYVGYGRERNIDIYLNTNGSVMTPRKVDELLESGFAGTIHVSFHGITPAVYERIMGLDYEVSLTNVLYLLERYDAGRVWVRGVDDGWPAGEKERWFGFWERYGVKLEYLPPISRCGGVGRLLPAELREKKKVRLWGCRHHHPLVEMVILFDGRAVMCCQDMGRELIWGNVAEEGILGVWNGAVRREALERLYSGRMSGKDFLCARCEQALGAGGCVQALLEAAWRKLTSGKGAEEALSST